MKRIGVFVCLIMMVVSVLAPAAFADTKDTAATAGFKIESSTPANGAKGVSVENLSVKIQCDKAMIPANKNVKNANLKQFKLTDSKGKSIPIKVYYSHKRR